jgi:hypothetical protein
LRYELRRRTGHGLEDYYGPYLVWQLVALHCSPLAWLWYGGVALAVINALHSVPRLQ